MARYLRRKAGNEWIEGDVAPMPPMDRNAVIEECAKVCETSCEKGSYGEDLAKLIAVRIIRALKTKE